MALGGPKEPRHVAQQVAPRRPQPAQEDGRSRSSAVMRPGWRRGLTKKARTFGTAHKGEVRVALSITSTSGARWKRLLGGTSVTTSQDPVNRFDPFVPTTVEARFQN